MADAFGRWIERRARRARAGRLRLVGSGVEAARQPGVRARAVDAGPDGEARGAGRIAISRRAAITRRCTRRTTAWRCFTSTAAAGAIRQQDGRFVVGDQQFRGGGAGASRRPTRPAGFSPNVLLRPDRPGHALPDDLLRRRAERARVSRPAARRLRALRRADAADVSARLGDAARFRGAALPHQVQAAARGAAGAGRSGAERAAEDADSAGGRGVVRRGARRRSTRR